MARRNKRPNHREQTPKPRMPRMPFPDEIKMGGGAFESKKPRYEEDGSLPVQCPGCGEWWSDDDLTDEGICEICNREEYDERKCQDESREEEPKEQTFEDSPPGEPSSEG